MLIRVDSQLKAIQKDIKSGMSIEEISEAQGTLCVTSGMFGFSKTDGYIKFLMLVIGRIPDDYGKQDTRWQNRLNRICAMAEKLQHINTQFTGTTREEFIDYCKNVSKIMNMPCEHFDRTIVYMNTSNNLIPFMEKHLAEGHKLGFYFRPDEDNIKGMRDDLADQLSGLKLEKPGKNISISYYLRQSGYHEHIHDALNIILSTAAYAVNCNSTRSQKDYGFDIQKVDSQLAYAEDLVKRIEHLI